MSKIMKRPMFRKGGNVGQGIMNKVERKMYSTGTRFEDIYKKIQPLYQQAMTQKRNDDLANFLIRGGMNLIEGTGEDKGLLRETTAAFREPTEKALQAKSQRDVLRMQGDLAALGAAAKISAAKTARPLKAQTVEGQVENYYSNISKTASSSQLNEAYALRPQITKAFRSGVSPRIAPKNMKGDSIDTSFYQNKPDGFLYINPITGRFEMVFNEKPFRRVDQDTLKPITTGE